MDSTQILLTIYGLAAVLEVVGITVTVSTYLREDPAREGLFEIHQAETRWQAIRGPVFIVAGVLVGLGGNAASLFV